jgi:aminomethyltransferase
MVDFGGWDMPQQYTTIRDEHFAVRKVAGLFDVSHMGRFRVAGDSCVDFIQRLVTNDVAPLVHGQAQYNLMCNEAGGVIDDLVVYRGSEGFFVVVNAANREKDLEWFRSHAPADVEIEDRTFELGLIAFQGPRAQELLPCEGVDLDGIPYFGFGDGNVAGIHALISRTGYTGEDGFELMVDADAAAHVWTNLQEDSTPCGLGARDTLRTEAGFALYGHEIDRSTNPYEARLGWVVSLSKASFVGRDVLVLIKVKGPSRRLVGMHVAPGGVPRPGFPILEGSQHVGVVTSGTFSPSLRRNIALAYVPLALSEPGQVLSLEMRGKIAEAEVVPLPLVPHRFRPRAKM